ncbi:MAG: hypothetical protein M1835_004720 [Candelina submexicana]|nr:MAG: hypothetical protein M1835_004720 [Candelina submexicana]
MAHKRKHKDISRDFSNGADTSKPTAVYQAKEGRSYTLSVALPGSIVANAKSHELQAVLAGQIGRALAVFCVDEVVIFNDGQAQQHIEKDRWRQKQMNQRRLAEGREVNHQPYTGDSDPDHFLMYLLSYLETPPYLRRTLFPFHRNLKFQGMLPSLDMPHHLRSGGKCQYREGVTVESPPSNSMNGNAMMKENGKKKKKRRSKEYEEAAGNSRTLVDAGLGTHVEVEASIPPNTRVTLKFPSEIPGLENQRPNFAEAVAPDAPREEAGYYWGYTIRRAPSLSTVLTECTYDGGYDFTFGTSERGKSLSELVHATYKDGESKIPAFKHMLVVFGGVAGLEAAFTADEELKRMDVKGPESLFDYWVNVCEEQGSRTIRTEEAMWIGLSGLRDVVLRNGRCLLDT